MIKNEQQFLKRNLNSNHRVLEWGCGTYEQFKTYITKPLDLGGFDLIFIDGRSRIECSKICKELSNKETLIFVHDYRGRYHSENYNLIEKNLVFISEIENLSLFKIK